MICEGDSLMIRDHYHYGMQSAADLARVLGMPRISVIEFGVAGGNGLVAMEESARRITENTGIDFEIYGFDTGEGMPPPIDYRDLPYTWSEGIFKMDREKLEARLSTAKLVIGNVNQTVSSFFTDHDPAPIGFIGFDVDYYSSTRDALRVFSSAGDDKFLPRVFCYFDDVVGDNFEVHCEYAGELLAIREYNEANTDKKICLINGLSAKLGGFVGWHVNIYVHHSFHHPQYNSRVRSAGWGHVGHSQMGLA